MAIIKFRLKKLYEDERNYYEPGFCFSWHRPLRRAPTIVVGRTLVRSVQYAAT